MDAGLILSIRSQVRKAHNEVTYSRRVYSIIQGRIICNSLVSGLWQKFVKQNVIL
jgi:hypothetical protein